MSVFVTICEDDETEAVQAFHESGMRGPVPVRTTGRPDIEQSVAAAEELYGASQAPLPVARGYLFDADLPAALTEFVRPLADHWLSDDEFLDEKQRWAGTDGALLLVGTYPNLQSDPFRTLIFDTYETERDLSILSGRDATSLWWNVAKQFAVVRSDVDRGGLFTSTDRLDSNDAVEVFDEDRLDEEDIQQQVLDHRWRWIAFQGHGKDDSINLSDFTVCGLNEIAPRSNDLLGPRCAYGLGCYKPDDKLIPLHKVRATEILLSACNSGPLADMALYDPKFQLLLNALDGPGQRVLSAVTVHDSDRPENLAWRSAIESGRDTLRALNTSLSRSHPYPAFVRFGLPARDLSESLRVAGRPIDPLIRIAANTLEGYLSGSLLSPNHSLRTRLTKLDRKIDNWMARSARETDSTATLASTELRGDLQSLDETIAKRILRDPEDELMNYPAYFGDRSELSPDPEDVVCHCGRDAQRFRKIGLIPRVLDTEALVCLRCGDVTFGLSTSPRILAFAEDHVSAGKELDVEVRISGGRDGAARVGLFVPPYLREHASCTPQLERTKLRSGEESVVNFRLSIGTDTPPQAYYFTVFAVQDMAISTARRHFGVFPSFTIR